MRTFPRGRPEGSLPWKLLPLCWIAASLWMPRLDLAAVDYDAAQRFTRRTAGLVYRDRVRPNWLPGGDSFWYRVTTGPRREEFVLIDAASGERRTAGDLDGLGLPAAAATRTSAAEVRLRNSSRNGEESGLRFVNELDTEVKLYWINAAGEQVPYGSVAAHGEREQHTFAGHVWRIAEAEGQTLAVIEATEQTQTILIDGRGGDAAVEDNRPRRRRGAGDSPDGRWTAFVRDGRVMLRDRRTNEVRLLATDLDELAPFRGTPAWSPDSSAFVLSNTPDWEERLVTVVNTAPRDQLQPKLLEYRYAKPGDELPQPRLVLFRVRDDGHDWREVPRDLFPNPYTTSLEIAVRWSPDSREFYFVYNQRGHQLYRILAADGVTADVRVIVEETSPTFIHYSQKTWRHWLDGTGELLWMSERDGWCHLWLYDVAAGAVKQQVTTGQWPVREVLHVDEDRREIWFYASGLHADEDPYYRHLCRVGIDGSDFRQLTAGDGDHEVEFSPDRRYFVDRWSRVDLPPVHELRRSDDGRLVCVLETADASALLAAGWTLPERFVAKGRDGETDIHGVLFKPSHFDPGRKYPILEEVYAGPQSAYVPKRFGLHSQQHEFAELGFIVVQVDGMGTNHRGKAFHDVCWKNLKDAGFPDRIAWIRAAAESRPWMDLSRVGIFGGSAGGQSAMRALLDHHDFYHVAVADCGCHDNRMDKIWWNEQWMGWPVDESYAASSNSADAHKLQGKLLLIVGELDQNVDPASTMQVVAALQRANKSFEFMPLAGRGHGAAETPYGSRLRAEFLMRHLLAQ